MVTSRHFFAFIFLAHLFTCSQMPLQKTQQEVQIQELERFKAMVAKDTSALRLLLADDLVYIHSNAMKENKQEHLNAIAGGKVVYQKMERQESNVKMYNHTAINTGLLQVKGLLQNNPFDVRLLYTAVYVKHGKTWQLSQWQSTRLP